MEVYIVRLFCSLFCIECRILSLKQRKADRLDIEELSQRLCEQYLEIIRVSAVDVKPKFAMLMRAIEDVIPKTRLETLLGKEDDPRVELAHAIARILRENSKIRRNFLPVDAKVHAGTNLMPSVFLSYRRSCSEDFVALLADRLSATGKVRVSYDQISLRVGSFPQQLGTLIRSSDALLLVLENGTLENIGDSHNFIRRELLTAVTSEIPVIPLLVDVEDVMENIVWPADIEQIAEQQAVFYKRSLPEASIDAVVSGVQRITRQI